MDRHPHGLRIQTQFNQHYGQGPTSAPQQFNPNYYTQLEMQRQPMSASTTHYPDYNSPDLHSNSMSYYSPIELPRSQVSQEIVIPRKKRYKPTADQVIQLVDAFEKDPLPSTASRLELSSRIDMRPRAIQSTYSHTHLTPVWFQNRRAKVKSQEKDRKNMMEFVEQGCPDQIFGLDMQKPLAYPAQPLISSQRSDYPLVVQDTMQTHEANYNFTKGPAVFLKPAVNAIPTIPTPIASPHNTLIQLQAYQNSIGVPTDWMTAQDAQQPALQPLMMLNSACEFDLNGYSAEELLKFLEM